MTDEPVEGLRDAMARVQPGAEADGLGLETTEAERAEWADDLDYDERPSVDRLRRVFRDIATLLADNARLKAELAEDKQFLEERIQERLDEINAEGEAFDKDSANALKFILKHCCGEDGKDTLDNPDGWNTQSAIDCIGEVLRRATAREATARAKERVRLSNIVRGNLIGGRYREWPCYGSGNRSVDSDMAKLTNALADEILRSAP